MAETIDTAAKERHWIKSRNLTFVVLAIWFVFGYVIPWFAKDLNSISFIGFPLGYYFCVQGSLLVFVLLIFFQNFQQDKIDAEAGIVENNAENHDGGADKVESQPAITTAASQEGGATQSPAPQAEAQPPASATAAGQQADGQPSSPAAPQQTGAQPAVAAGQENKEKSS